MKRCWLAGLFALIAVSAVIPISANDSGVTLIGTGSVPADALDLSGLAGQPICQKDDPSICIDQATFGGLGSAVTYTGFGDFFLATPDRGPFDGRSDVPFLDRFHVLRLKVNTAATHDNITVKLVSTRFLRDELNHNFVGDAYAFNTTNPLLTRRFDPEGVTVGLLGTFFVSDEYGPYIREFDATGRLLRRIKVPARFLLDPVNGQPSGDLDVNANSLELSPAFNTTGRQANRGMEGLTITPNGRTLVGIMQNALLQDHGWNSVSNSRVGFNNRILTVDLLSGKTHEYVYVMDALNQGKGVNEMLAINDHEFLVLERDNRTPNAGQIPSLKRIYRIDLAKQGLTDVSGPDDLQQGAVDPSIDPSIVPVTKTLFIDLLDPGYKVNDTQTIKDVVAEKIEGLAWGPTLKDGQQLLYVFSDNDLAGLPTQIYAFAIDTAAAGVTFGRQRVLLPALLPRDILKALK